MMQWPDQDVQPCMAVPATSDRIASSESTTIKFTAKITRLNLVNGWYVIACFQPRSEDP